LRRKRLKISAQDFRYLLAFAVTATIVTSGVAYGVLNPPPSEQFYAMYILGSNGLAEHYYPNDNPNLTVGQPVNWTIGVYNHMGSPEYVVVRVKLLNSTLRSPDELTGTPSSVSPLLEFVRVMVNNETWTMPFVWTLLGLRSSVGRILITEISINQFAFTGDLAEAASGFNYRLVFELWFYDMTTNGLVFSWHAQSSQHSVWTQIWFNVTTTVAR
jgi:uncharacterized membrane protein